MTGNQRCSARSKRTGLPCKRWALKGSNVCASHGAAAGQVKRAASRRLALGAAELALDEERRLGRSLPVEPAEAMLEMVREAAANVAVLRSLVEDLEVATVGQAQPERVTVGSDDDGGAVEILAMGPSPATIAGMTGSSTKANEAAPHVWVVMYNDERERLMRWAKACRDAGVDERRVEIAEGQARMLATVLKGAADALLALVLGVAGDQRTAIEAAWREQWPVIARAQLAAVSTTEVGT